MAEKMTIEEFRKASKTNKYKNEKTLYNGQLFDSKKEAGFAKELDSRKHAKNLRERVWSYETQIPFQIILNGKNICKYIADFRINYEDGREEIVDVKGKKTAIYSLKKKLVEAQYGIEIIEV